MHVFRVSSHCLSVSCFALTTFLPTPVETAWHSDDGVWRTPERLAALRRIVSMARACRRSGRETEQADWRSVITLAEQSGQLLQRSGDGATVNLDAGLYICGRGEQIRWRCTWKAHWCGPTGHQVQVQILMLRQRFCRSHAPWECGLSFGENFAFCRRGIIRIYWRRKKIREDVRQGGRHAKGGYFHGDQGGYLLLPGLAPGVAGGGFRFDSIRPCVESPASRNGFAGRDLGAPFSECVSETEMGPDRGRALLGIACRWEKSFSCSSFRGFA